MFNSHVTSAARHWESKQAQDSLTQEAIERHSETKNFETKFLLQHQEAERAFNLDAADKKNALSKEQGEWFDKSWQAAKESAARALSRNAPAREQAAPLGQNRVSDIRQQASTPKASPMESEATAETATGHEKPIRAAQIVTGFNETPTDKQAAQTLKCAEAHLPEPTDKTKEAFVQVLGGTQNAFKQTQIMPEFFSTSSQTGRERGWRQHFDDEASGLNSAANLRQGAIVEPAREYKNVAVQESLMPRLQELVQKLSSMGHSWARVVVPVDSRTNVIVRFNSQSGKVKIHLSTPSEELCEMIKSGWNALVGNMNERGINLDDPTFETNNQQN